MKKILPLIILALISCVSYTPVFLDLSMLVFEGQGEGLIVQSTCQDNTINIKTESSDKNVEIRFDSKIPSVMEIPLCSGKTYFFSSHHRPDGPIEYLKLMDDKGLLAYLGDGLRTKKTPGMDFTISTVKRNDECVRISNSEGNWIVKMGKPETILIEGVNFTAYLLNTRIGTPEFDQPPLKVDLILIRE